MQRQELDEAITALENWFSHKYGEYGPKTKIVIDAAKKYRDTLPCTIEMQVYNVEYVFYSPGKKCWIPHTKTEANMQDANVFVQSLKKYPDAYSMIKITGPHYRSVPA